MSETMPDWKVMSVTPTTTFVPGVGAIEGSNVNFETNTGLTGSVFVSRAQVGDTAAVKAAVIKAVGDLHAIHSLTG